MVSFGYFNNWNCAWKQEAQAAVTYFDYDANDNPTWTRLYDQPGGNLVQSSGIEYDQRNRPWHVTGTNGTVTTNTYDVAGNLTQVDLPATYPGEVRQWRYAYDTMNRRTDAWDPNNHRTQTHYNSAGQLYELIDPNNNTTSFTSDLLGRRTQTTYPGGTYYEAFTFDDAGNPKTYRTTAGQVKTWRLYDSRNRVTGYDWSDGGATPSVSMTYDAASRLMNIVSEGTGISIAYTYNDAGQMTCENTTLGALGQRPVSHHYDAAGNRSSLTAPSYELRYSYDARNRPAVIMDGANNPWFTLAYDASSRLTKWEAKGNWTGAYSLFAYNGAGRTTMAEHGPKGGGTFARSYYAYDAADRLQWQSRDEDSGRGERFAYDPAGQLTFVGYNCPNPSLSADYCTHYTAYSFDAAGNRQQVTDNNGGAITTTDFWVNALNHYTSITGHSAPRDNNFDMTSWDGVWQYTYDAEKRLKTVANTATGFSMDLLYDPIGRCVRRIVNGVYTHITYDGWQPLIDWDRYGNLQAYSVNRPGATDQVLMRYDVAYGYSFLHQDGRLGHVQYLTGGDGSGQEIYRYDVYGRPTITDWSRTQTRAASAYRNRFMFTGREYFPEVNILDLRHRHFKPNTAIGSFMQPDPAGYEANPNGNLYGYCGNDPVNNSDPMGLYFGESIVKWFSEAWGRFISGLPPSSANNSNISNAPNQVIVTGDKWEGDEDRIRRILESAENRHIEEIERGDFLEQEQRALAREDLERNILDSVMGEGYYDFDKQRFRDTLNLLTPVTEVFVFVGVEKESGPLKVEGFVLAGANPYKGEAYAGAVLAGGYGPILGGREWTTQGSQNIGILDPGLGFGGYRMEDGSKGLFFYQGHAVFFGFGVGLNPHWLDGLNRK